MKTTTIYQEQDLPQILKPLVPPKGYICDFELDKILNDSCIELTVLEKMKLHPEKYHPLDAYTLGITKGFSSLKSIISEFISKDNVKVNSFYIITIYLACKPFFKELNDTGCVKTMADKLLWLHEKCKTDFMEKIND